MITFITHDGKFSVTSHGNGWAYEVTERSTGDSFWVQDHDADQLQADTNDFEWTEPLFEYLEART